MFNVGAGELVVILIAALVILGPKQLPELARGLGKFLREFRRQTDDVRNMVEREFYRMDEELQALPAAAAAPTAAGTAEGGPATPASEAAPGIPPAPEASVVISPPLEGTPVPAEALKSAAAEPKPAATPAPAPQEKT